MIFSDKSNLVNKLSIFFYQEFMKPKSTSHLNTIIIATDSGYSKLLSSITNSDKVMAKSSMVTNRYKDIFVVKKQFISTFSIDTKMQ